MVALRGLRDDVLDPGLAVGVDLAQDLVGIVSKRVPTRSHREGEGVFRPLAPEALRDLCIPLR